MLSDTERSVFIKLFRYQWEKTFELIKSQKHKKTLFDLVLIPYLQKSNSSLNLAKACEA